MGSEALATGMAGKGKRGREAPVPSPVKFPYAKCTPLASLSAITSLLRSLVSPNPP